MIKKEIENSMNLKDPNSMKLYQYTNGTIKTIAVAVKNMVIVVLNNNIINIKPTLLVKTLIQLRVMHK